MMPDALILFLRYPEKGRVKTRIAVRMGDVFALGLYESFIKDILMLSASVRADKIIALDKSEKIMIGSPDLGTGYKTIWQRGEDIGERMYRALASAYGCGYERAVLIGGDCPDMPVENIENAFASLHTHDLAIGRSADGGYYIIGCTAQSCAPDYFRGIEWGSPRVFKQTMVKISESGKKLFILPEWRDIDDMNDIEEYYQRNRMTRREQMNTMQYLNNVPWDRRSQ